MHTKQQQQILTYKYRLQMTPKLYKLFGEAIQHTTNIYNAALEEQIDRYKKHKLYNTPHGFTSKYDQYKGLTELRQDKEYSKWPTTMQRWAVDKCQDAMKAFFKRCKLKNGKAGFPRFKSFNRSKSFGFTDKFGWTFNADTQKLKIKGFGSIRVKMHRSLPKNSKIKMLTISNKCGIWYVNFVVEIQVYNNTIASSDKVGIDVGIRNHATLSDGITFNNPQITKKLSSKTKKAQQELSRCKRGSKRRQKVRKRFAKLRNKEYNTRNTHLHQMTAYIAKNYDTIYVEKLNVKGMSKNKGKNLNRGMQDASLSKMKILLMYKVQLNGGELIEVNPQYTSQTCSSCGHKDRNNRKNELFKCLGCGYENDADLNAAINISNGGVVIPKSNINLTGNIILNEYNSSSK